MKGNVRFYSKMIAVIGIAILVAGTARTSPADDGKAFADKFKFTTIDFPGAAGTATFGINLQRDIVGTHNHPSFSPFNLNSHGFLLNNGKFTNFDVPGASPNSTQPNGINLQGDIVGSYADSNGKAHGFLLRHGTFSTIDPPGTTFTFANGISLLGDIVGFYTDSGAAGHGFLLKNGRFTTIDVPGAASAAGGTEAQGINPQGDIVGTFGDANFNSHGFVLKNGKFTVIDVPQTACGLIAFLVLLRMESTRKAISWDTTMAPTIMFMVFCCTTEPLVQSIHRALRLHRRGESTRKAKLWGISLTGAARRMVFC